MNIIKFKLESNQLEEFFEVWDEVIEKTGMIAEEFLPMELAIKYEKYQYAKAEKNAVEIVKDLKDQLNNGDWLDRNWYRLARAIEDELEKQYG